MQDASVKTELTFRVNDKDLLRFIKINLIRIF